MDILAILKLIGTGFGFVVSVFETQRFSTVRKIPMNVEGRIKDMKAETVRTEITAQEQY
jgi:hypothetical protein